MDIDRILIKTSLILTKVNFFFFDQVAGLVGSQVPNQGLNPAWQWKPGNPNHQATRELPPNLKILTVNSIYIYAPVNYLENTGKRKKKKNQVPSQYPKIFTHNILMLPNFFLCSQILTPEICICFKMKQMHTIGRVLYFASFFWHYHKYYAVLKYTLNSLTT